MKLKNNSVRDYNYDKIFLKAGQELEITDKDACQVLLKQDGVIEVVDIQEVERLKAEVKKLKEDKKTSKSKK